MSVLPLKKEIHFINKSNEIPEKNLGGDIAVLLGLVPGLADDAALGRAQQSGAFVVGGDGGHGSGHGGRRSSGLQVKFILKYTLYYKEQVLS